MRSVSIVATFALLLAAAPSALAGDPPAEKPAAVVRGREVPRRAVYESLARRRFRGEEGAKVREQFLLEAVARREQEKRGVAVTDDEVRAAVDDTRRRTAEQLARQGRKIGDADPLEGFLKESGFTLADFAAHTRHYLALQKMARADLGSPGEVPVAQIEVWLRDLAGKWRATADPAALKPGEAVRVGEAAVSLEEAGRWLARTARRPEVHGIVHELAFEADAEGRAAREGATLSAEDTEAEVARLRAEFLRQPGVEEAGASFDGWLGEKLGMTIEEFRRDASFRAGLLAKKVLAAGLAPDAVRKEWEARPERYGETARIRILVVHGEDRASAFGAASRPMAQARRLADEALEEIRAGKPFETVARKRSEDAAAEEARGRVLEVAALSQVTVLPQPILEAIFRAKDGDLLGPLQAIDGWYLVRVERRLPAPAFEACAPRVREDLLAAKVREWKIALRAEVEVAEDL